MSDLTSSRDFFQKQIFCIDLEGQHLSNDLLLPRMKPIQPFLLKSLLLNSLGKREVLCILLIVRSVCLKLLYILLP